MLLTLLFCGAGLPQWSASSCGHHVVHDDVRDLVRRHEEMLQLHGLDDETEGSGGNGTAALEARRRSMASATPAPIRVHVEYQELDDVQAANGQATLKLIGTTVMKVLQKYVKVKSPVQGNLLVVPYSQGTSNIQCGLASVNGSHIARTCQGSQYTNCKSWSGGTGEPVDYYVYITAVQSTECDNGAAAWAAPCILEWPQGTNRPLMGSANICPAALYGTDQDKLVAIVTHEMMHALGFTDGMFSQLLNDDGTRRVPVGRLPNGYVTKNATLDDGSVVTRLITPRVVAEARAQFGCSTLDGAQLEDNGSAGSANSHWEFNHYQGELLVASAAFAASGQPARMSRMTLAYLEDTGWYVANYSAASYLDWGKNVGCALPTTSCTSYQRNFPSQQQFCNLNAAGNSNSAVRYQCPTTFKSTGACRAQNFSNGCGLVTARGGVESCLVPDLVYDKTNAPTFGWVNGPFSRCYPVTYLYVVNYKGAQYTFPSNAVDGDKDAICWQSTCDANKNLYLNIFNSSIACPTGATVDLANLFARYQKGSIGCPNNTQVCQYSGCSHCSSVGGECYQGTCYCKLPYDGSGCFTDLKTNSIVGIDTGNNATSPPPGSGTLSPSPPLPSPPGLGGNWVQVVQLTLSLNITLANFSSRQSEFIGFVATWANLPSTAVTVQRAAVVAVSSSLITQPGGYNIGMGIRRRQLRQSSNGTSSTTPIQVVSNLVPSSATMASALLDRINDPVDAASLLANMELAGLAPQASSLQSQTIIVNMPAPSPPPAPPPDSYGSSSVSDSANNNNTIIIVVVSVVSGVIVAAAAIVLVFALRRSRAASKRTPPPPTAPSAVPSAPLYSLSPVPPAAVPSNGGSNGGAYYYYGNPAAAPYSK